MVGGMVCCEVQKQYLLLHSSHSSMSLSICLSEGLRLRLRLCHGVSLCFPMSLPSHTHTSRVHHDGTSAHDHPTAFILTTHRDATTTR